jgi:curved DNA-binding protein CbpA
MAWLKQGITKILNREPRFNLPMTETETPDYYEFLEISPNATQETIHRVYRFLASRYHPDSAGTGDLDKFAQLTSAYSVLSDPERRAEYNAQRSLRPPSSQNPMSSTIDFMDQVEGDLNRRLAVLAILYYRRRTNPSDPEVPLAEIERRMGFPRDYLDFTTWYLTKKGYVTRADNADYTLTVDGVDHIETQRTNIPLLDKLLTGGCQLDKQAHSHLPAWLPSPFSSGDHESVILV